jgi:hypothetical protein
MTCLACLLVVGVASPGGEWNVRAEIRERMKIQHIPRRSSVHSRVLAGEIAGPDVYFEIDGLAFKRVLIVARLHSHCILGNVIVARNSFVDYCFTPSAGRIQTFS